MKTEDQIKALAELAGAPASQTDWIIKNYPQDYKYHPNRYLTSYDAIIPLRTKVCNTPALKVAWLNHARTIVARRVGKLVYNFDIASIKPDEDCEALLRATNKWTE